MIDSEQMQPHGASVVHRALNFYLSQDPIRVIDVEETPSHFHSRFHAIQRTYKYMISTRYCILDFQSF